MTGIRVDANEKIAMGHVMRCLSIAKCLKSKGEKVIFWTSGDYASDFIRENGFECKELEYDYCSKEEEVNTLIDSLRYKGVDKLLIDSYQVTQKYMEQLHSDFQIIYLDDMNAFCYPADLIINYTYNVSKKIYEKWKYAETTKFLLGREYVPLRPQFKNVMIDTTMPVNTILITTGGADEQNMILEILHRLSESQYEGIQKLVVAGKFYSHMEELKKIAEKNEAIQIHYNVNNMAELMKKSNIAISAGGTTLAELCACGMPIICFSVADNQLYGTRAYANDEIVIYAGDVRKSKKNVLNNIVRVLEKMTDNASIRTQLGNKAHKMIDGNGAERIAEYILQM